MGYFKQLLIKMDGKKMRHTIEQLEMEYPGKIIITVRYPQHAPGHRMSGRISACTYSRCVAAINEGKTIHVGNSPHSDVGEMIAQTNSRYHGQSIRTIRAI